MSNINKELEKILSARYGKDVRQALYEGISTINDEVDACGKIVEYLDREVNALKNNGIPGGSGGSGEVTAEAVTSALGYIPASEEVVSQLAEEIADIKENGTGGTTTVMGTSNPYRLKDGEYNVLAINHRGYSTEAPENTIPAYILSKEKGFNYVECDVSFTSDGVAVLLHDATIDRTSDGSGSISSMTYSNALQYDFGSWKDSKYTGTKIPTFEEFIMLCKAIGLHPYIELKSNGGYTQAQITGIVDMVESCGMKGKVTYISFNATFLGYVKTADNKARLGYLADVTDTTITTANGLKTEENEVFMDVSYSNVTEAKVSKCIENELPLEIWTVNNQSIIENMNNYVSGVTSDNLIAGKILYDKYMTYTPPETPEVPATGISLNQTTLVFDDVTTQTLIATVEPTYSTDTVIWTSSNKDVATVSNGIVTPIAKGSCTITATAGSVSATCEVTVNVEDIVAYTITRNLTNCSSSSSMTVVNEGTTHTETISASAGYVLSGGVVSITMGGVDISSFFANGVLTIDSVNGDIVITVSAVAKTYDWVNDKLTFTSEDIVAGQICPQDIYPYYRDSTTRMSYMGMSITLSDEYAYKVNYETVENDSTYYVGVQQYGASSLEQYNAQETITKIFDSGWVSNGYKFLQVSNSPFAWITFKKNNYDVLTPDEIVSFTITRMSKVQDDSDIETKTLIHDWDFTQGLEDSVGGVTAVATNATQDANGITLNSASSYVTLLNKGLQGGDIVVVDVASSDAQLNGQHGRFIMIQEAQGFIYRNAGYWDFYNESWNESNIETNANAIDGKQIKVEYMIGAMKAYIDGTLVATHTTVPNNIYNNLILGSTSNSFYNVTVSRVRVYRG